MATLDTIETMEKGQVLEVRANDGTVFRGTPAEILAGMHALSFERDKPVEDYIAALVQRARDWHEQDIVVPPGTPEERAAALISEAVRVGLLEPVEAEDQAS